MTVENEEIGAGIPQEAQEQKQNQFSKEDIEKSFQVRLGKEKEKRAEMEKQNNDLLKRLGELEKRVESGKATQDENLQYQSGIQAVGQAQQMQDSGMVSREQSIQIAKQLIYEQNEQLKMQKLGQKLKDASAKDPEFMSLAQANPDAIRDEQLSMMTDYENAPAMIKKLLKDPNELKVLHLATLNAQSDSGVALQTYLNKLSNDIEATSQRPSPNPYSPHVPMHDVGEHEDFDVSEYLNNKI